MVPFSHISQLKWNVVADLDEESKTEDAAFNVHGLEVKPLRLHHGGTYLALGFLFGAHGTRVAYLSDTNGLPARTMVGGHNSCLAGMPGCLALFSPVPGGDVVFDQEILQAEKQIDVLILDSLFVEVPCLLLHALPTDSGTDPLVARTLGLGACKCAA